MVLIWWCMVVALLVSVASPAPSPQLVTVTIPQTVTTLNVLKLGLNSNGTSFTLSARLL